MKTEETLYQTDALHTLHKNRFMVEFSKSKVPSYAVKSIVWNEGHAIANMQGIFGELGGERLAFFPSEYFTKNADDIVDDTITVTLLSSYGEIIAKYILSGVRFKSLTHGTLDLAPKDDMDIVFYDTVEFSYEKEESMLCASQ